MVDVPILKLDDTVTKARQILRDDSFREIYIHDGKKKLLGYIDISDVLQILVHEIQCNGRGVHERTRSRFGMHTD